MEREKDIELRYCPIVFLQGDEAEEPLAILHDKGRKEALEYLLQWDYGERPEENKKPSHGTADSFWSMEGYIISCNWGLGYIGLDAVIEKEVICE